MCVCQIIIIAAAAGGRITRIVCHAENVRCTLGSHQEEELSCGFCVREFEREVQSQLDWLLCVCVGVRCKKRLDLN